MIDYTLYGLNKQDVDEYHKANMLPARQSVLLVLTANKPITKQNLLACLIRRWKNSPMIIFRDCIVQQ